MLSKQYFNTSINDLKKNNHKYYKYKNLKNKNNESIIEILLDT